VGGVVGDDRDVSGDGDEEEMDSHEALELSDIDDIA